VCSCAGVPADRRSPGRTAYLRPAPSMEGTFNAPSAERHVRHHTVTEKFNAPPPIAVLALTGTRLNRVPLADRFKPDNCHMS
jgi:hypothetical protein